MSINWKEKGREYFDSAQVLIVPDCDDELAAMLREEFADLLAAVRWGAEQTRDRAINIADSAEREALRLLTDGMRERLTEISDGKEAP